MKTNKIFGFLSFLMIAFSITSCVQDGDFTVPDVSVVEPNITANSSVLAIKTALQQEFNSSGDLVYTFFENEENPTYVEAYVVSSDATGNFYKKLMVQDKPENPTAGIEIIINQTSLSETFDIGRKIYIKLDGLSVSYDDGESANFISPTNGIPGKYVLGVLDGDQVDDIPSTSVAKHIFRSATVAEIVPTSIKLADITGEHISTMIQLPSAQMLKSDLTKTFAGESNDEFDGFRTVFECETEKTIQLQTSTFASFKSNLVPQGKGTFTAVLSKDFRSEFLVAIANKPSDLEFTDMDRCDPPVLDCGTGAVGGSVVLLEEDFENITTSGAITAAGWTNVNVNGGSTIYQSRSFSGNRYLQISAFRSGETPLEVWLVSPEIDLDATTDEELTFETNTGFDNGKALSTYVSSDFTGDVTTATWLRLDAVLSEGPSSGYGSFVSSGSINVSCLSGKLHVAFKYEGADNGVTTTFQVDNVKVTGK
ncbi:choice-of-anchor J domain-containing protein [Polaribacter pectinis]|uniref:Choice-of-anchor J domain-containing protein n=1 Tax=Polaribacter pectinis TaxID=2738844 RepID=A0A7G9LA00_9FLAO|nr:DUF5689 domain-containing protein [Polaribacter pectinis]QNM85449.1 choice-of-anchor J domain-containing protein [Polaribacter pectinis]